MSLSERRTVDSATKYRKIAALGRGGMANVHLAALKGQRGFTKLVVVKELRPELAIDPQYVMMFAEEARISARLSHPNVVQTFEVHEEGPSVALVMEYLDGQTYMVARKRLGPKLSIPLHVHVLCEVLEGLHHAHELRGFDGSSLGLVHRDVSPQNVILTYEGDVKLLDFGIAKLVNTSEAFTQTGILKGKIAYMAPEQIAGGTIDRRADLFSIGVMLWEGLAGKRLWAGIEPPQILGRLMTGDLPALPTETIEREPGLSAVCHRALSISPDQRYPDAPAMIDALEATSRRLTTTRRSLARLLGEDFAGERRTQADVIERQLALAETSTTGEYDPVRLSLTGESVSGVRSVPPSTTPEFASDAPPAAVLAVAAPESSRRTTVFLTLGVLALSFVAAFVLVARLAPRQRSGAMEASPNLPSASGPVTSVFVTSAPLAPVSADAPLPVPSAIVRPSRSVPARAPKNVAGPAPPVTAPAPAPISSRDLGY